jgi:hypothetical protein
MTNWKPWEKGSSNPSPSRYKYGFVDRPATLHTLNLEVRVLAGRKSLVKLSEDLLEGTANMSTSAERDQSVPS